jgi:dTDP-4-dehydrorhamnose 3,5-epimerase
MIFTETRHKGAFIIEPERIEDERGFFARTFCEKEFAERGLETRFVQDSVSFNRRKGTLRGLHYQTPPHAEIKLVRCTRGAIHDVIVDLRPGSATFRKWLAVELTAENGTLLYVPKGVAHGFQTLMDNTEVLYSISVPYGAGNARGVRWDDPAFGIRWPLPVSVLSARDREYAWVTGGEQ